MQSIFSEGDGPDNISSSENQNADDASAKTPPRYPMLKLIAGLYKVAAVLFLIFSIIRALSELVRSSDEGLVALVYSGAILLTGVISFFTLWAFAELIKLFMDTEENTRRAADLLQLQVEVRRKE